MDDKVRAGENMPNTPPGMDELARELDSMPVEDLREEMGILLAEMDEDSFDGELLEMYLDAIERKSPRPRHMDNDAAYELLLKRLKNEKRAKRRGGRGILKVCLIAAAIAALLVASMAVAQGAGLDLFGRIARWTAETFGFASDRKTDGTDIPPQLKEMGETLVEGGISTDYLPAYWPEGYEQIQLESMDDPESNRIAGAFCKDESCIILSYISFQSGRPEESYSIDVDSAELYEHDGIEFHIMTNEGEYLAVWNSGDVECRISGVESYEELIKILDSIGERR